MPSFDLNDISFELRPLAFYAQSSMRDGTQIVCPQQHFVMGDEMPIYIGFEDVYHFISFKEISANSIMIYIRYLVECCARTGIDQRFEFISPVFVSPVQQNVDRATYVRERAECILRILRNAPKGKRFLMPYNSGQHWILAVIDPWDDSVMYFNPLGNEPGDDFKDLITTALNDWKLLVGSGIRQRRNWQTLIDTVRCPIQEGYVECGYFVLAYMREITFTVDGLAVLQTKDFYTDADISLAEWTVIESKIQAVKDVIQSESLEENSVIINMFISVMELISKEMGRCKKKRGAKKDVIQKANVSHSKSENNLLGMIFYEILNFEIAFCRPIFSMPSADRVLLLVVEKYTRQLLASKMGNIRSYMNKLEAESASISDRDPRKKKLKEKLNVGIGNLWKKLELQVKN
ncbi:hypothetical protein TIFTF001_035863 [Ficus carica]|uniref:Ubiquitin-like protease family profile domain-containing protein n=1 Tax=Ficus carica TaxID=3494 RepID=A0AA88JA31_FICCA|nr:hypothetical protein TIFTF001_035863 [Ficus carica]